MPPVPLHAYYGVGHPEERESELETISSDDIVTPDGSSEESDLREMELISGEESHESYEGYSLES